MWCYKNLKLIAHEKKNIEALKEQQAYQQNQPKVKFNGVEQPYGTDQQSQEQRRSAFLEQIRQTRDQQTQQQNKEPER